MRFRFGRPPVVLLGGLGQIWSLALAAIPVVLATADPYDPAAASRYLSGRYHLPAPGDEPATIAALTALGIQVRRATGKKAPLFCGNDRDLKLTYTHREQLAENFLLFDNPPEVGLALLNKEKFQALARAHDLPIPRVYSAIGNGADAVCTAPGAVIVKPRSKSEWRRTPALHALFPDSAKAKIYASGADLQADPDLVGVRTQVLIQDYIPGDDDRIYSFHGLADDGDMLSWFVGRKIRTFPKSTGESAFIELITDDALAAVGKDIARRLNLRGVFKMDFKRGARDGKFYLLEINARFSLWHHLGAVNGINMPAAVYAYLVDGVRPVPSTYTTRYRWQNFGYDLSAYRELRALHEITLWHWLRSLLQTRRLHDYFSWKDPAPFMRWLANPFIMRINKWRSTAL